MTPLVIQLAVRMEPGHFRAATPIDFKHLLTRWARVQDGCEHTDECIFHFYATVDVVDWDDTLDQAFGHIGPS